LISEGDDGLLTAKGLGTAAVLVYVWDLDQVLLVNSGYE
jgi:hypothetical protein